MWQRDSRALHEIHGLYQPSKADEFMPWSPLDLHSNRRFHFLFSVMFVKLPSSCYRCVHLCNQAHATKMRALGGVFCRLCSQAAEVNLLGKRLRAGWLLGLCQGSPQLLWVRSWGFAGEVLTNICRCWAVRLPSCRAAWFLQISE